MTYKIKLEGDILFPNENDWKEAFSSPVFPNENVSMDPCVSEWKTREYFC